MEELTCGNIEKTRTKYMMPPIKSNCQFFFRNFRIFPKAICTKLKNRLHHNMVVTHHKKTEYLVLTIKGL